MSKSTVKERQNDELELLKSIYDKDITANLSSDWTDVYITLQPLHNSQDTAIHVKATLHVKCNESYPNHTPEIELSASQGLSKSLKQELLEELVRLAEKLKGEVMIFELAQKVQEYLHRHNKPETKSFYDEMVHRQQLEMHKNKLERVSKIKKMEDIIERVKNKRDQQKDDSGSSNDSDSSLDEEDEKDGKRVRFNSNIRKSESDIDCIEHHSCKYLQFDSKILRGRCLVHDQGSTVYYGLDNRNGEPVSIREWVLKLDEKQPVVLPRILRQVESLRNELIYLRKLKHENLQSYLDFKHIIEKDYLVIYIVQQFVSQINLAKDVDINFTRNLVIAVVSALQFLHQNNVIHKSLTLSSIHVDPHGTIKVGDFSLLKRIDDLSESFKTSQVKVKFNKFNKQSDIYQLGLIILHLLGIPEENRDSQETYLIDMPDIRDFLEKCFWPEERRWSAKQLLKHSFLKFPLNKKYFVQILNNDNEDICDEDDLFADQLKIPSNLRDQSRISKEFKVLKLLGSGSFGKVLKAKHRLDNRIYAIKVIELQNAQNEKLYKKMIREVKLLSKLNHENVVRYFSSWAETANVQDSTSSLMVTKVTSTPLDSLTEKHMSKSGVNGLDDNDYDDDDDDKESDSESESDDDSDSPDRDVPQNEESDSIVFMNTAKNDELNKEKNSKSSNDCQSEESTKSEFVKRVLYIQMEYCEKSTLRKAIDSGLNNDKQRCWRLVREIIEGLAYIHQQDMIHRDLKPVNIFLDSEDHAKIGDFGLATTAAISRANFTLEMTYSGGLLESDGSSHLQQTEDSHTGGVGTFFYVAPELEHKNTEKAHYSKKVDIYSLGIILFEIFHPPFPTHMERCQILTNLRRKEIILPFKMDQQNNMEARLIRELLNHDPFKRPTCSQILSQGLLPPLQVGDCEIQELIRHTVANPNTKAYKFLISECFRQKLNVEENVTYDVKNSIGHERLHLIADQIVRIMRRHGARCIVPPLLQPVADDSVHISADDNVDSKPIAEDMDTLVMVMTHSGGLVALPRDLHEPIARLVARRGVTRMRGYQLARVFRERRLFGLHPKESWHCAFDIISTNSSTSSSHIGEEWEMLCILDEIVNEFPVLKSRNCVIRINHALILQGVLNYFGMEKVGKFSKTKLISSLYKLHAHESVALVNILCSEDSLKKIKNDVLGELNSRSSFFTLINEGLEKLKSIIMFVESLGFKTTIKVAPGLVTSNMDYSGIMFDLICPFKQKGKRNMIYEVLASGYRFDSLMTNYRAIFEVAGHLPKDPHQQTGIGLSVVVDKIHSVLKESGIIHNISSTSSNNNMAIICSLGQDNVVVSQIELARALWAAGQSVYILGNIETLEDLDCYGRENHISHIIWLKESERNIARIRTWDKDKDRYLEKKLHVSNVADHIARAAPSESSVNLIENNQLRLDVPSNTCQMCNIHVISDDKLTATQRRSYEIQVKKHIANVLLNFSSKPSVEVIATFLNAKIIRNLAISMDFCDDDATDIGLSSSIAQFSEKYPRMKKYLSKICDKIESLHTEKKNLVLILYSLSDNKYKQII